MAPNGPNEPIGDVASIPAAVFDGHQRVRGGGRGTDRLPSGRSRRTPGTAPPAGRHLWRSSPMKTVTHWIGGKPFGSAEDASGTWGPVTDPATGQVTTRVAMAGAGE